MSSTLKEVGVIIGEASSSEFFFASKPGEMPSRWEYLLTYSEEDVDGKPKQVEVVAQIERVISASQALTKELDFEIIKKIIESGLADKKVWGKARVLGYLTDSGDLQQPKKAVMPGKPVYIAPAELLEKFYSYPEDEAIKVGALITRSEVPVSLSVKGFRRHLAIIAQTGSGKTYLAGIIVDELLRKGGTIIMLDPHADYVFLSRKIDGKRHELADRITVFRNPSSTGRYTENEVGNVKPYEICFSDLDLDEICLISGISQHYTNIVTGLGKALEHLKADKDVFQPEDLLEKLENVDSWKTDDMDSKIVEGARSAAKYLARLVSMRVFTSGATKISEMLKPMHLSVVDLSGLDDDVSDYIAFRILSDAYEKVASGEFGYPVFVFVEEAHKFIPATNSTYSSSIIKKIAAEGRKFGIFLVVITQRPSKIHSDALSQCNSQIIMRITNPKDQAAVAASSERLGETLLDDLPGLNTGEAVIVGEMTRAPIMARIRKRTTREGGSDIDIMGKMKEAIEKAKEENVENESRRLREEMKGFMNSSEEGEK
ncbi:MAG: ATP-binding protein [Candidatus Bathyarchaeota archaeon]|nr:ATP-binding protein [Candidatus Bathyarchaeota archaeon A05DMB-3]MDH7606900.1 ATP-binding protein [Candidatus Bathyarchaeota archaeon]